MNWLHYLLEANLYLAVFYALYYLFLRSDTHYALSRIYLLATSVISFVIPFLQLGFLKPVEPQLIQITLSEPLYPATINTSAAPIEAVSFDWQDGLIWAYLLGVAVLFVIFSIKIYQLFKLTRTANTEVDSSYKLIYVDDSNTAFSFFNFLFIGTKVNGTDTIIQHELVHIRQKHSVDIVFMELLKIVNWFNPFIYLLQASLKTIHEYIADEQTATNGNDVIAYSTFLVNNAYGLGGSSITHSFFNYNLLKKRIIMLNQQRSGNLARLKYLLAIPISAGLLCASTLAFSKDYGVLDIAPAAKADIDKLPPPPPLLKHFKQASPTIHEKPTYTKKGYRYVEDGYAIKGKPDYRVIIFEKNGDHKFYFKSKASAADLKLLREKYGYTFPVKEIYTQLPPPPPPEPSQKRFPPPIVREPSTSITKTGYRYEETGYTVNGKTDFMVIIFDKNTHQKAYFKSKASATDLKLLREKYGYTFPVMKIYTQFPPAPPVPVKDKINNRPLPPPPPAPPVKSTKALIPVPKAANSTAVVEDNTPVIVVNGEVYNLKEALKKGQELIVDASGGVHRVAYSYNDLQQNIKKYGPRAKNGVIFAYGKTSVTIKQD